MNKLIMCLLAPGVSPSINTTGMEAASVPFEMMLPVHEIWKNFTVISGSIAAIDLGLRDHIGTNLSFSLSLMQSQNKLCLNLYHPWFVSMPHGAPTCNSLQFNPFPKSIGAFVLPREDKKLTTGSITPKCADNSAFDVKLLENPAWTVLLGKVCPKYELFKICIYLFVMQMHLFVQSSLGGKSQIKPPFNGGITFPASFVFHDIMLCSGSRWILKQTNQNQQSRTNRIRRQRTTRSIICSIPCRPW